MGSGNYNRNEPEIQKSAGKDFLAGSLVGGLIGMVLAILWAPKPGKEVRGTLNEKTQGINSKVKDLQNKRGKNTNSEAEEAAEEVAKAIEEAAEDLEREQDASTRTDNLK